MSGAWVWALLGVLLLVAVLALRHALQLATRLDRLHLRILSTRDSLDALAVRRAAESRMLAGSGLLGEGPSSSLGQAALECLRGDDAVFVDDGLGRRRGGIRDAEADERLVALRNERESALSRAIRETLTPEVRDRLTLDPRGRDLLESLEMACYRLRVARSMHNLDVSQVRRLREQVWVRLLHLYGRAPWPDTIDFDDATDDGA